MTTERKPSERAVERWAALAATEIWRSKFIYDDQMDAVAAIISKHFPPSLESELAEALEMAAKYVRGEGFNEEIEQVQSVLTTYHQRKETTK